MRQHRGRSAAAVEPSVVGRDARHGRGAAPPGRLLAADAGVRRAGAAGERRLHGPGQLGHRSGRRRTHSSTTCCGSSRLASFMAIFLQVCSARLGVVTGKDLAQACRDWYPRWTRWPNWLLCEIAIGACDLAEVLGSAVAINLLFHIPLFWAVIITACDVLSAARAAALRHAHDRSRGARARRDDRRSATSSRSSCCRKRSPNFLEMGHALITPGFRQAGMAYVAIGIIGATVMPHNLYLHSALVQSRKLAER